jgi:putative pyoverdin transport system ATP-binding/permease protein
MLEGEREKGVRGTVFKSDDPKRPEGKPVHWVYSLLQGHWRKVAFSLCASVVAGASNSALLAFINSAVQETGHFIPALAWAFGGLCVVALVSSVLSQVLLTRIGQEWALDFRMRLCRSILSAPLGELQRLGRHRLLATLTEDIEAITSTCLNVPALSINLAMVIGCLCYLGWLSWELLLMVLVFITVGITTFQLFQNRAIRSLRAARAGTDSLFNHFRALTEGIKELKMHRQRRHIFVEDQLYPTGDQIRRDLNRGIYTYTVAEQLGNLLFYVMIGLILFAVPGVRETSPQAMMGYTLGLLYLMTPLSTLMQALPALGEGIVALQKIDALGLSLVDHLHEDEQPNGFAALSKPGILELSGISHRYYHERDDHSFVLGPLDLTLHPGELVFLIGGNGSGKTTLALLLVGLYVPEQGHIRLNGELITDANREAYRQQFTAVFADPYLFESLLGYEEVDIEQRAREVLVQLQLEHKVRIEKSRFSTLDLSQGQCKRMVLLSAYLDNRPFCVFDEWAADQDPIFKKVFYTKLLPDLKRQGKAVVVITHDDQYFDLADRCIKLVDGQLIDHARDISTIGLAARTA